MMSQLYIKIFACVIQKRESAPNTHTDGCSLVVLLSQFFESLLEMIEN